MKIVPDTSVIINGRIDEYIRQKKSEGVEVEVIIPEAVLSELEHIANSGKEGGLLGLERIKELKKKTDLKISGEKPKIDEIRAKSIDGIIMNAAKQNNATLITSDLVLSKIAELKDVSVEFIKFEVSEPEIFKFFDPETMSIHIKATSVLAKKGKIGNIKLVKIAETTEEKIEKYSKEITDYAYSNGFVEISGKGALVAQIREFRVVAAKPPFSDGYEITVVRPIVKKSLGDYNLSSKLLSRLKAGAEGIFIAGPPGAGKSTFAQSLAEFYMDMGKIVKTMESPRDLQVRDEITQYGPLDNSMEKTSDILLLVRPDYTIYDELRKTKDFEIFADMRLAGVGMVGVTHSSKPIDAIQRMIKRVELGMIPHIVDTIIFIKDGQMDKVYELSITIKVPHGMREADLARPIIQVRDFESMRPEYELYSYGEEVVVIPIKMKGEVEKTSNMTVTKSKKNIILQLKNGFDGEVKVYAENEFLFNEFARKGNISIPRNSPIGSMLLSRMKSGRNINVVQM